MSDKLQQTHDKLDNHPSEGLDSLADEADVSVQEATRLEDEAQQQIEGCALIISREKKKVKAGKSALRYQMQRPTNKLINGAFGENHAKDVFAKIAPQVKKEKGGPPVMQQPEEFDHTKMVAWAPPADGAEVGKKRNLATKAADEGGLRGRLGQEERNHDKCHVGEAHRLEWLHCEFARMPGRRRRSSMTSWGSSALPPRASA